MSPSADAEAGEGPLHRRILAEVRDRIVSGEWPPGHRIPFESELAQLYGCSRMTVNKALTELARGGLIERRRRSGSFVSRPRSHAALLEIRDVRAEVEALGAAYRYELLSEERLDGARAPELGVPPAAPVRRLLCRHHAGERPFCLEDRLISLEAVPQAAGADFGAAAPGQWLLSHVPWSEAEHRISADMADGRTASLLRIGRGSACLVVERRTWTGGTAVTAVRFTYPAERHSLVARFAPASPPA